MFPLIGICVGFLVFLWCICGVYAQSVAQHRLLPEVLSSTQAILQGPLWLKRALIWSTTTLPPTLIADTNPASTVSRKEDIPTIAPLGSPAEESGAMPSLPPPSPDDDTFDGPRRPKKLPRRPLRGSVKTLCPHCTNNTRHDRDAHCSKCGHLNPWLREEWKLESAGDANPPAGVPAPPAYEPQTVEEVEIISSEPLTAPVVPPRVFDDTLALEEGQELEAFDALPKRPRAGSVKTVCPLCHKKTKHDRDATCKQCQQPNNWLGKRWGLLHVGVELKFQPPPTAVYDEQVVELTDPSGMELIPHAPKILEHCPRCARRAFPDYHGNCAFCGASLQENNHG